MASPRAPDSPRGLIFAPCDADLVTIYLQRKISGSPLPAAAARYIHDADVYAAEPAALVTGLLPTSASSDGEGREWYFFTSVRAQSIRGTRRCRAVAGEVGTWHSEKARCDVLGAGGAAVGYRQPFTYEPQERLADARVKPRRPPPRRGDARPLQNLPEASCWPVRLQTHFVWVVVDVRIQEEGGGRGRALRREAMPAVPSVSCRTKSAHRGCYIGDSRSVLASSRAAAGRARTARTAGTQSTHSHTADSQLLPDLRPHSLPPPRPRFAHASEFGPERHVDGTAGQLRARLTSQLRADLLQCHDSLER
ncbi:hypothetical protein ACQJBY_000961 [Aegilops geniculata]